MKHEMSYTVLGLSCGSCANALTKQVQELDGVLEVRVDLVPGQPSGLTVEHDGQATDHQLQSAIDDAGFSVVGFMTVDSS